MVLTHCQNPKQDDVNTKPTPTKTVMLQKQKRCFKFNLIANIFLKLHQNQGGLSFPVDRINKCPSIIVRDLNSSVLRTKHLHALS